jgi:hypothetical protein
LIIAFRCDVLTLDRFYKTPSQNSCPVRRAGKLSAFVIRKSFSTCLAQYGSGAFFILAASSENPAITLRDGINFETSFDFNMLSGKQERNFASGCCGSARYDVIQTGIYRDFFPLVEFCPVKGCFNPEYRMRFVFE